VGNAGLAVVSVAESPKYSVNGAFIREANSKAILAKWLLRENEDRLKIAIAPYCSKSAAS